MSAVGWSCSRSVWIRSRCAGSRRSVWRRAHGAWKSAAVAEFYRLSIAAKAGPLIASGVMTAAEEARLEARVDEPDFLGCGFAFIGAWGRRPAGSAG